MIKLVNGHYIQDLTFEKSVCGTFVAFHARIDFGYMVFGNNQDGTFQVISNRELFPISTILTIEKYVKDVFCLELVQ